MNLDQALRKLKAKSRPGELTGLARFGITGEKRLGVAVPELRKLAKEIGKDHGLALKLWKTGVPDAMLLAGMVDEPEKVTEKQMDAWVKDFQSWDVCDQVCSNLFDRVPFTVKKINQWAKSDEEFIKRAAFAMIASVAWHDKEAPDKNFIRFFPLMKKAATDERNFVRKAVNWALRNIGKKNPRLNREAIKLAKEIQRIDSKAARWIAADAIRELESPAVQARLRKS
ncbi:MAG: DNA alkylation repair protein [Proteobacteria bacterium]|nr:DNA alkylation repair protein [Pseudomonadota bacterium]